MGAMDRLLATPGFGEVIVFRRFYAGARDTDPTSPTYGNFIAPTPAYVDTTITANIQCADNSKVIRLGLDIARRSIEVFSTEQLKIADQNCQTRGDRVWYADGPAPAVWYEVKFIDGFDDASGANFAHCESLAQKIIDASEPFMEGRTV